MIEVTLSVSGTDKASQLWTASMGASILVEGSRVPSCDACRELLKLGHKGIVAFRHADSPHVAFTANVERMAGLTVEEGRSGPAVVKYHARDALNPTIMRVEPMVGVNVPSAMRGASIAASHASAI